MYISDNSGENVIYKALAQYKEAIFINLKLGMLDALETLCNNRSRHKH